MRNTVIGICVAVIIFLLGYILYPHFNTIKSSNSALVTENTLTNTLLQQSITENKKTEVNYDPKFIPRKEYSPEELEKRRAEYEKEQKNKTYTYINSESFMDKFYIETTYEKLLSLYKPKVITTYKSPAFHDESNGSVFWEFETENKDEIEFYNRNDLDEPWLNGLNIFSDKLIIDGIKIGVHKSVFEKKFNQKINGNTVDISREDPDSESSVEFSFENDILKSIVYNSALD